MVALSLVSDELSERSRACRAQVSARLSERFPEASVEPLGSSFVPGSMSRGDIDLLVSTPPEGFQLLSEHLQAWGEPAQVENWTEGFASVSLDLEPARGVGVQLVRSDLPLLAQLREASRALHEPETRRRYDAAKVHGQSLSPKGYWQVKDAFWSTWRGVGPRWCAAGRPVLKILRLHEWQRLLRDHETEGAPVDVRDGFVHLSTPDQVGETVAKHFSGAGELWLLTLDAEALGPALRWEVSRGGDLFPHLYGALRLNDVCLARPWMGPAHP